MNIYGEHVILRALEPDDNDMLLELINDPETESVIGGKSWPTSMQHQRKWLAEQEDNNTVFRCAIISKESNDAIGTLILNEINWQNGTAQIHIKMAKNGVRGKGYGTDAVRTAVNYSFDEMRLHCIYAYILDTNEVSRHMFEKCGFKPEGILHDRVYKGGRYIDLHSYYILSTDPRPLRQ